MGVHGLSSFFHENQRTLAQSLTLPQPAGSSPVPLVVDGWSFIYRLHNESRLPWVFGGEYDAFHEVVRKVVGGWIAVGFQLYFVFDGPYTPLKFKTGIARVNEGIIQPSVLFFRTSSTSRGSPRFLRETAMLPPLCYMTTIAALRTFGDALELHFADGEGDPFAVELAGRLGAFVAGQDSDFAVLNSESYAGYLPMDEMLWSTASEDESLSQSTSSLTPDDDGFKVARPKGKANRDPVASKSQIYGLIPPDTQSSSDLSLKCTLYTPHALASHFNLPVSLLPLLGALVGNDFTAERKPIHNLFFERNFSAAQRLSKVATTLHSVLPTPSATKKRPKKPITSVVDIIELAVDALLLRSSSLLTSGERDSLVEKTIEAALQYAIPGRAPDIAPELWPTPSCAIHSPERCPLVETMSRPLHDTGEDDDSRLFRADARTAYMDAYRQGRLDPRIVDAIHTATMWPKLFLEDPDLESVTRSITRPLREWMYAILEAGVGLPSRAKEETAELSEEEEEAEESDEDELVDVVEEDEDEEDDKNDPLAPLRGALQQLNFAESDADTDAPSVTSGAMSAGAPARNVIVTEHVRRGTHLAEEDIPVRPLRSMLKLLGEDDFFEAHAYTPPALWPAPARFTFFLRILASDTPAIRALTPRDLLPILSLRWVVGRLHTRAMEANGSRDREKERWTQREAQAFLSAFGTSSDAAAPEADSPPPNLTNRNVQLVAQVLTSISTIRQLAQALILSEQVPDPAPRFSGTRFHTALADPFHCSISDEVWTAAVGGLEHAFAAEKVKPNKKGKKEAQLKARTSDKARGINGRQASFSLLSMLEDE